MPQLPGFTGGSNRSRSLNVSAERTVNLIPEKVDAGQPAAPLPLYGSPGLAVYARLGSGPVRALFYQDGRCFAVSGTLFYEVFATHTATYRGTVASDAHPATIHSNGSAGHQLFIVSGGKGYIFDLVANTLTLIVDADFPSPCAMGGFCDGYFLALKAQSIQFHISALENGLLWDGLDVAQVSQSSDQLRAMAVNHREVWLFGSKTTVPWTDTGDAGFPFAPYGGTFIEQGIAGPFTWAACDNTLYWIGENAQGGRVVYRANGYTPERVSTHAVEFDLSQAARVSDAICWSYQDEGHLFFVCYVPTLPTTWYFDVSTGLWHERALWNPDTLRYEPDLPRCQAYAFGQHLVGDRQSGTIYRSSLDLLDYDIVIAGMA